MVLSTDYERGDGNPMPTVNYGIGSSPHALYICELYDKCQERGILDQQSRNQPCGTVYLDHINYIITEEDGRARHGCNNAEKVSGNYTCYLIPYRVYKENKNDI